MTTCPSSIPIGCQQRPNLQSESDARQTTGEEKREQKQSRHPPPTNCCSNNQTTECRTTFPPDPSHDHSLSHPYQARSTAEEQGSRQPYPTDPQFPGRTYQEDNVRTCAIAELPYALSAQFLLPRWMKNFRCKFSWWQIGAVGKAKQGRIPSPHELHHKGLYCGNRKSKWNNLAAADIAVALCEEKHPFDHSPILSAVPPLCTVGTAEDDGYVAAANQKGQKVGPRVKNK